MRASVADEVQNVDLISTLMEMRNGQVAIDSSRKWNELMAAVIEHGKKGKFSLVLEVTPTVNNLKRGVGQVSIAYQITINKPDINVGPSMFFVGPDGKLSRNDPDQMEFFENKESSK